MSKNLRSRLKGEGVRKGRPNLIHTPDGMIINKEGVVFTPEEKKLFEQKVNSVNRKRNRQLKELAKQPRNTGGIKRNDVVGNVQSMGKEGDFIIAKRSKSLHSFTSREQFETRMKNLNRVLDRDYLDMRIQLYKDNYIKALENTFGDDASDIVVKINSMSLKEYREMVEKDELLEINYIYGPEQRNAKLQQIRTSFNIPLKEDEMEDF